VSSRGRESDRLIVPMTPPKATRRAEGRGRPEGSSHREGKVRTQGRGILPANLTRVNDAAKKDKRIRFTALLHHVDVAALERAFRRVKRTAAPGWMARQSRATRRICRSGCGSCAIGCIAEATGRSRSAA
jgi:hypothetical protein